MIFSLLKFELKYQFRQISFILAAVLFLVLGCFSAIQGGFGGSEVHKNAPYVITNILSLFSLFTIFAATLFSANVVLRDHVHKMESVIYTTAIQKMPYFFFRLAGLLLAVFSLLVATVLGIYLGTFFADSADIGAFNLMSYIQPLLVFGLPNVLFACSLIFCTTIITKNVRAIYASGVLLYILYMAASIFGNSPLLATSALKVNDPSILPFLIDPFGLASFFSETKSWTDIQRNQQLFPVQGAFLANRLLWLGFSLMVMWLSYRFFNFRLQTSPQTKQQNKKQKTHVLIPFKNFNTKTTGWYYNFSAFKSQFKLEVISLFKHIPFMVMLLLWGFIFAVELKDSIFHGPYGIKYYPSTASIIEELRSMKFSLILLIFYAAELIGRERSANMQALIYSTPVKNSVLWLAKCLTLCVLLFVLVTVNIIIGLSLQVFNGYLTIDLSRYLSLYYYSAFPLILFMLLIVFIQNLASNKYVGMMLSMMIVLIFTFAPRFGIEHLMLRFAAVPDLQYSFFNGFGYYAKAFNWYLLYWSGFAIILAVLTVGMWQNSTQLTFLDRLKSIPKSIYKAKYLVLVGLAICVGSGAFIYQQSNVIGRYANQETRLHRQINYEKKFKAMAELPQPTIKSIKTEVDLFPTEGRYEVRGRYRLKNETDRSITRLWVSLNQAVTTFKINIPYAKMHNIDPIYNHQFIDLAKPLQAGEEMDMDFELAVIRSGFVPFDSENSIVENGTYIEMEKFVPRFGYHTGLEITDDYQRKKAGLAPYVVQSSTDSNYHKINLETTISTVKNQQVVTVGALKKSWYANNRHYFTYQTTSPINFMFALSSANYQLKTVVDKGVTIKLYYLLGEAYNVNTMLRAIKDALAYGSANFATYPLKQFTLAAIPQYKGAATAYPGLVFNAEKINYLTDYSDSNQVNQSYAVTTHEVAHQWWVNLLVPRWGPGDAMLTESLAKYTEVMLMEKHYGKMYLSQYLRDDNNLYFVYRNPNGKEYPLAQTYDQNNVHYQKGGLVFYSIKEVLGEKILNKVLKDFLNQHVSRQQNAKSEDLVAAILKAAPANQKTFIEDSFNEVVIYDMDLKVISCKAIEGAKYGVTLQVNVTKNAQYADKPLPPDMDIDVALFAQPQAAWDRNTKPLYLKKHHFNQLQTIINIVVDQKPTTAAIDPYAYLLDGNLANNVQNINKQ